MDIVISQYNPRYISLLSRHNAALMQRNAMLRAEEALTAQEAGRFAQEELLVQGTIDCCFIEDGKWVLLDYKTDRTQDMDAIREHYRAQLGLYALALERITGRPVKQHTLCLIAQDRILEV